jgi:hypothetical protein
LSSERTEDGPKGGILNIFLEIDFFNKFTSIKIFIMSKTKTLSDEQKIEMISDETHDFYRGGFYYNMIPEQLRNTLDKQSVEFYDFQDKCYKSSEKVRNKLLVIINEQYPVYSTVDYFWMEDEINYGACLEFTDLAFQTFSLCENIKDKQPLDKIYAHLGLWKNDSKHPRQDQLLKVLRGEMKTISDTEWDQLLKENKVFGLLDYQNNENRYSTVYDAVKKGLMAEFPAMKQFGKTEWSIYNAMFEKSNQHFRIKLFLLELRLDCVISSRFFENKADNIIEKFIKLPKYKRAGINKLAERRMMGEKI